MKPLSIFILNCDWGNMYENSPSVFRDKLERDRLGGTINNFFIFSWARISYTKSENRFSTVHKKTRLDFFRPLLDLRTIPAVFYYVYKNKIRNDIWLTYDFGFVPALWIVKTFFGGKLIMCLNNQPRQYSRIRKFGFIKSVYSWLVERIFSGFVDHFFTINETMRNYIKKLGVNESNISVFTMDTIERDKEFIEKAQNGIIRKKYNLSLSTKILLTVGRLEAEKNYPRLLELFSGLDKKYVLIALGSGSLLPELEKQCQKLGITDRVFFPGFVHRNEIWNYYADADIFVLLSKVEALGMVFWEAMYSKVPILGSNVEGILESTGIDGDRGNIWKEEMGQKGFNEIITSLSDSNNSNVSSMVTRAYEFVKNKMSNNITINDIFYEKI